MTNRTVIPFGMVNELLDTRIEDHKAVLRECWISYNPTTKRRIAIDNTSWDFFMEEFNTHKEAISWVKWEFEVA